MKKKYGKNKDSLKLILDKGETKALKSMEKIIRATEICTLKYVLKVGGDLNTSMFYPFWFFSDNPEYFKKTHAKYVRMCKRGFKQYFIRSHFKKVEISGKTYYQLKK